MSDHWIRIVPALPDHVPALQDIAAAKALFAQLAPEADEIVANEHEHIQFFDCGGNLEAIVCPRCKSQIELDWWGDKMNADFDGTSGFKMKKYELPCCSANFTLNELSYSFHQAFGQFALSAMNPNIGMLSSAEVVKFEAALACKVSVVYQHL